MANDDDSTLWQVRIGQPVWGGAALRRDLIVQSKHRRIRFTVTVPWNDRGDQHEEEERWAQQIFGCFREIAAQDGLPIRR